MPQHSGEFVIEVEEGLQVAEVVGPTQLIEVAEPQRHAVARGQRQREVRLEGALDVHVQLGGGQRRRIGCGSARRHGPET
jgi:hypothetical protein